MGVDNSFEKLREAVRDCFSKGLNSSAIFFADKLYTLTKDTDDLHLLGESYYRDRQFKRARHLLEKVSNFKTNLKLLYLAAKCAADSGDWEDCLDILGEETVEGSVKNIEDNTIDIHSAISLLRGKAFLALENRTKASYWLKEALKIDSLCYEAFEHLVDLQMISSNEASNLLTSLRFTNDTLWLHQFYLTKLKKFNTPESEDIQSQINQLEHKYNLVSNADIQLSKAENYFYNCQYQLSYEITSRIIKEDPYNYKVMCIHISSLVELKLKNELYYCSHKLVELFPNTSISWYAVASYYYLVGNFENSRRYFSKCTTIDSQFGSGWLAFGHTFALQSEHDQAMSAYRTAARILPEAHLPLLYIAMELIRVNNFNLAEQYLFQSKDKCSRDPLIYNELGVISYKNKEYSKSIQYFSQALDLLPNNNANNHKSSGNNEIKEVTLVNMAHSFRKLKQYNEAIKYYTLCMTISTNNSSIYVAMGFTYQLQGQFMDAIDCYHKCLALKPEDSFATDCLTQCLELISYS